MVPVTDNLPIINVGNNGPAGSRLKVESDV
jgi:hypothetical protein